MAVGLLVGEPAMTDKLAWGTGLIEFRRLAALETDECVIWPYSVSADGYGRVWVAGRHRYAHRCALALREQLPSQLHHAAHGPCQQRRCMNYRHLRWATAAENEADKVLAGRTNSGTRNGNAWLTPELVTEIRNRHARGDVSQAALARDYGICKMQISKIVRNKAWTILQ